MDWWLRSPGRGALAPGTDAIDMVLIPGGPALLGDNRIHAMPGPSSYPVDTFSIDRFEVTNRQFARFVSATDVGLQQGDHRVGRVSLR